MLISSEKYYFWSPECSVMVPMKALLENRSLVQACRGKSVSVILRNGLDCPLPT